MVMISLLLGFCAIIAVLYLGVKYMERPPKCPKCGKELNVYYDKESNVFSCECECGYNCKV